MNIFDEIQNCRIENVRKMIDHYPSLMYSKNNAGETPLQLSIQKDLEDVATLLIQKGSDVNAKNCWNSTPMHYIVYAMSDLMENEKLVDIAKLLIDHGININLLDDFKNTPLYNAVWYGTTDMVKLLLSNGAKLQSVIPILGKLPDEKIKLIVGFMTLEELYLVHPMMIHPMIDCVKSRILEIEKSKFDLVANKYIPNYDSSEIWNTVKEFIC